MWKPCRLDFRSNTNEPLRDACIDCYRLSLVLEPSRVHLHLAKANLIAKNFFDFTSVINTSERDISLSCSLSLDVNMPLLRVNTHRPFRHEDRNEVDVSVFVTFELISDVSVA